MQFLGAALSGMLFDAILFSKISSPCSIDEVTISTFLIFS